MKALATVTSKGQVTVPKLVRDALGVAKGDVLEFELTAGSARVRLIRPARRSAGILKKFLPKGWTPPTVEEMDRGMGAALARRIARQ